MRIIGGSYRGKKLFSPQSEGVRPTADRARESVFNILNSKLDGGWETCRLLEIFAGTGAFSLEAISRGAAAACLIDINPDNARRNIALFPKEQGLIKLLKADALKLPQAAEAYNLLFMDAPYAKGLSEPALRRAAEQGWLQDGCLCVIELEKNEAFDLPSDFERLDERCYGIARFLFARYGR